MSAKEWPDGFDPDALCLRCHDAAGPECRNNLHNTVCRPPSGWGKCSCGVCLSLLAYVPVGDS